MRPRKNHSRQRGFSLAEVLVATAILVVVLVGILTLYDRANRVFKSGNEAADLQQNVRIAYERMVGDIRMAGFDFKRGGPLLPGQSAAPWASGRTYSAGTIVTPTSPNGNTYRAINQGTSGLTEPAWPTGQGATVVENGATPPITWQQNGGAVYEQPDEQIEYAGATALTVRGNFDYSVNPIANDHGRDTNLESAQFPVVTTGNDEIVTYALVSNSGPNADTISFYADTSVPRNAYPGGSAESQVQIAGVDLSNTNPPYTLYRFTLNNAGAVVRTPLADNIRSLNFFYFQDTGGARPLTDATGAFAPNIGGAGQYDPAVANSVNAPQRLVRKKIRAIRVRLIGMNAQPDVNLQETDVNNGQLSSTDTNGFPVFAPDTNPAIVANGQQMPAYRKVTVDTLITPRNLGMTGMPQNFLQPPPRPTVTGVCIGYCGIAVVNWDPNTNNPDASYVVMWDTDPNGSFSNSFDAGTSNTYAVDLTQQDLSQTFYFQVRAFNAGGSVMSTNSPPVSAIAANATVPNPPTAIRASGGGGIPPLTNKVHMSWTAPVTNASGAPTCTPSGTPGLATYLREIKGFRVYRGNGASFTPSGTTAGTGNCILDENASGPTAPHTDGYGNFTWDDTAAGCGTLYYYKLETIEWCVAAANYNTSGNASDSVSAPSSGTPGEVGTTTQPARPVGVEAAPLAPVPPPAGMSNSVCNASIPPSTGTCNPIYLRWQPVTTDISTPPNPVTIDSYDVMRVQKLSSSPLPIATTHQTVIAATAMQNGYVTLTDSAPQFDPITHLDYYYEYSVAAIQSGGSCPNGAYSTPVVIFPPPCSFSGSVFVVTGALSGNGLTPATAWILNGGDTIQVQPPVGTTFVVTRMDIVDPAGNIIVTNDSFTSPANFTWADLTPGTPYTVTFTMTNNVFPPCTEQLVRYITQQGLPACSLTTFAVDNSILVHTATTRQLKLDLRSSWVEALTLTRIKFVWAQPGTHDVTWNSVQFPSGGTVAGPGTNDLVPYIMMLSPRPITLTANDITVPATGTRSLLLNFGRTTGNPEIAPSNITSICVDYTVPSVNGLTFHCQVKPDNPTNDVNSCS